MLVSLPFGLARLQATFLERLPQPLLTRDQVTLLRQDNVVAPDALTLKDLGIAPTAPEAVIETYLDRYRPGGRFGRVRARSEERRVGKESDITYITRWTPYHKQ